jgi:carbonic anhydrase
VPPHTQHTGGITASIEFAVAALEVPHIVICGHTECGAMKGALDTAGLDDLPHVREWLGYTKAAVDIVNELAKGKSNAERMKLLLEQNVILQLQHLRTHPTVAKRLAMGNLQLHGWVYDIGAGAVSAYDENSEQFSPVAEHYAEEVAKISSAGHEH